MGTPVLRSVTSFDAQVKSFLGKLDSSHGAVRRPALPTPDPRGRPGQHGYLSDPGTSGGGSDSGSGGTELPFPKPVGPLCQAEGVHCRLANSLDS
jgi:hypothetical protein